ncbi:MAG: MlaD family protein [Deltaproteobacteria bacterium]|nr:MlaD family protein [Deltaproteobacteria bacterium]
MARKNSHFMIGLFVAVGLVIGVAAIVWVGASKYFEEGAYYVTYFDESVQGLQVDSRVKYRGVDIGKVQSIGVAPDHKLVEVVMKIDLYGESARNLVTQLRAAGITGIVFIELDRPSTDEQTLMPPPGMEVHYPVIASQSSQTKQIITGMDKIMGQIQEVDLKGISDQIKATTRALEILLSGKQMTGILAKLDSAAGHLDQGLQRIDRLMAEGRVEGLLDGAKQGVGEATQGLQEARKTISDLRELVATVRREVESLKAPEIADRVARLLHEIDRRTRGMKTDFERTTEDIRQAADSLKLLLDRLNENPSDLIFSEAPDSESVQGEVRR